MITLINSSRIPEEVDLSNMPARITRAGSRQTYYTFRWLVGRHQFQDALRSYAYFRWLDDLLDCDTGTKQEKNAMLQRQQQILEACYRRELPGEVSPEEQMLVELIQNDRGENSGVQIYLRNMMAVMAFDVGRCGRVISLAELAEYTNLLSTAVTELLFYFIGREDSPSRFESRYKAVQAAHVVHMLRDLVEDISAGYINVPDDIITSQSLSLENLHSLAFRKWVFGRVKLARSYFMAGRHYMTQVKNFRCRLAAYAYMSRFEWMMQAIEKDGYCLRPEYPDRKTFKAGLWMAWRTFISVLNIPWIKLDPGPQVVLPELCEEA